MDKRRLLDAAAAGDSQRRLTLARVLDRLEQAQNRGSPAWTDFLSPQEQAAASKLLAQAEVGPSACVPLGGYQEAERQIFFFPPDWMEPEGVESPLRYLRATYRPEDKPSHRDLLGSLMGLGIGREKVGDLLVGDSSCDLIVLPEMEEFLLQSWRQAGRARLQLRPIEPEELSVPPARYEEVRDTVMSPRLDALAAGGFRLSRSKAAALISGGKVQVNWQECLRPDRLLAQGDLVSARGYGKFQVAEVAGLTRKGRIAVVLRRYL